MAEPGELERAWRLVESRGIPMADTLAADPLSDAAESPMVAVDSSDARHLLIPLDPHADVPVVDGAAVTIRKRTLIFDGAERVYADIVCARPDLYDQFAVLASEIIGAAVGADAPAADAARVIREWRELVAALNPPRLDRGGLVGLFAELSVLRNVVAHDPRRRSDCWTGASRGRYDFQRGEIVLEVKGSTARRGRPIVVHGIDQLEAPPNGALYLSWIRLEVGIERGESLRRVVDRLLDIVADPADLEQKLRRSGYEFDNPQAYDRPLLTELERRFYRVDESFPKLTRADLKGEELPRGVIAVRYELDLSGDRPEPLESNVAAQLLRGLAGVS